MTIKIGNHLATERDKDQVTIYKNGILLKRVAISNAFDRRLLIVDLVNNLGAQPSNVAKALEISRQTVYNTLESYQQFGNQGLLDNERRGRGNKARIFEEQRKQNPPRVDNNQLPLQFTEVPEYFAKDQDWKKTRYAGGLIFSALLEKDWNLISFFAGAYGQLAKVFIIIVQMLVHQIKSIEQFKALKFSEFGLVCGLGQNSPSRTTFSQWLHAVADKRHALVMIGRFFRYQIKAGLVSIYLLYVDGNFKSYTGRERLHKGYSTQRRLAMPGQTTYYFHDASGRIVYFNIEEGHGDLRQNIENIARAFSRQFAEQVTPLFASDRESWCVDFFCRMSAYRLLTWEKNTNEQQIKELPAELFGQIVKVHGRYYRFYEFPDRKEYWNSDKTQSVFLRRIVIWNLETNRRPVCVSNDTIEDTTYLGCAMLGRWGNSENGFKYMEERFNPYYIPLLQATTESENQEIKNPVIKELQAKKKKLEKKLQQNAKEFLGVEKVFNKDGSERFNSKHQRLSNERSELEAELAALDGQIKQAPAYINLKEASNGKKSFKVIDNEAKNLFDLTQAMVWNARRTLIDMLKRHYNDERDVVNLLDHITRCQGWVKSTRKAVLVKLEPMDLPRYRVAQKELVKELNNLKSCLPNGKAIRFFVAR